jgi:hypothetical protein
MNAGGPPLRETIVETVENLSFSNSHRCFQPTTFFKNLIGIFWSHYA